MEYNHELLATIATVEDKDLEQRIKKVYQKDECATRILKQPTDAFTTDL